MTSERPLTPAECCLHIVDVQESLMRHIDGVKEVVSTITLLIHAARILGLPMIANTQYRKGLGDYVPELEALVTTIPRPDKVEFNALANQETAALVAGLPSSVTTLILVGVETHICIYQTAMGALRQGLRPWIVTDGVSSRQRQSHQAGLRCLEKAGAMVGPAEMLIYELLGKAGTPQFKELLPFIVARNG